MIIVHRKHTDNVPIIPFERLDLQNVSILNRVGRRRVAHNRQNKTFSILGINNRNVDFETRNADVVPAFIAVSGKLLGNILADSRPFRDDTTRRNCQVRASFFRKIQEGFQAGNPFRFRFGKVDHCARHGREYHHLFSRSRHRNVESAPTAHLVQRPEIQGNPTRRIRSVANGEQNHVTLVPLYVFQVLDKQRFFTLIRNLVQLASNNFRRELTLDIFLLHVREGNNANA